MEQLGVPREGRVLCPLNALCGWATYRSQSPEQVERELRDHLAEQHRDQLRWLLAAADGAGLVNVQTVGAHLHLSGELVRREARHLELVRPVEHLRQQLTAELVRQDMRPLDPWPAVTVRRLVWSTSMLGGHADGPDLPAGMRELQPNDPQPPDLYQLELRTLAVPDGRPPVTLEP